MSLFRTVLWSLGTICLAAIVSFLVARETRTLASQPTGEGHSEANFHDWLHENLKITAEQEKLLTPYEIAFEEDRKRIRGKIDAAGRALADAIRNFDADSAEVKQTRKQLTALQGELQQVTLDHFFAMKQYLSEEQGEKLLRWTHDSIVHGHHD